MFRTRYLTIRSLSFKHYSVCGWGTMNFHACSCSCSESVCLSRLLCQGSTFFCCNEPLWKLQQVFMHCATQWRQYLRLESISALWNFPSFSHWNTRNEDSIQSVSQCSSRVLLKHSKIRLGNSPVLSYENLTNLLNDPTAFIYFVVNWLIIVLSEWTNELNAGNEHM